MENQKNQPKVIIRVLQVGDFQIGKTSLYKRYIYGYYESYPIYFLDFFIKDFEINGQQVKIQFWDYQPNERIHSLPPSYYKGFQVLLISYDITNRKSFENVFIYYGDYNLKHGNNEAALFLVGNKCDLEEQRQVSYEEGKQLSESLGMIFMEVSAKEYYQVKELFEKVVQNALHIN